jgi:hypothetical protein
VTSTWPERCALGGLPVESAFEQQGASGVMPEACGSSAGALELGFEFALEAVVLFGCQIAVAAGVDESTGGTGGVVEQRHGPQNFVT